MDANCIRKTHNDEFKFKVALTAIKGEKSKDIKNLTKQIGSI
jgi:hypothetical protein